MEIQLKAGEEIVHDLRQNSQEALSGALRIAAIMAAIALVVQAPSLFRGEWGAILIITAVFGGFWFVVCFASDYRRTEFVLTNQRLCYRSGLISRRNREYPLSWIASVGDLNKGRDPSFDIEMTMGQKLRIWGFPDIAGIREDLLAVWDAN